MLDEKVLHDRLTELGDASHWLVAFSGGVDSTVLLQLLSQWCATQDDAPPLLAIHVNHQLQGESEAWQAHCEAFCAQRGVALRIERVRVDGAGEQSARKARYRAFEDALEEGGALFLAHHLDDQVETFFLRLMRGAGLEGLAAIPSRRALGGGELVRPLLDVPRADILAYARSCGLTWVEDPSNRDTSLDRNFLRAEILPLLESRWPAYRSTVGRAAGHLDEVARSLHAAHSPALKFSVAGDPGLALAALNGVPPGEAARALRHWLRERGCQMPDAVRLQEFLRQLSEGEEGAAPRLDIGAASLIRYGDGVYLLPVLADPVPDRPLAILPGETLQVAGVGTLWLEATAPGEAGLELYPEDALTLQFRGGGERCRPLGRSKSTSLKKFLQASRVPPWWRDRVPLLYLGETLLAIGDLTLCQSERLRSDPADADPQCFRLCWRREIAPCD